MDLIVTLRLVTTTLTPPHDPMKIYRSDKIDSDAPSGVLPFRCMNGYGSENDAFFFCPVSQRSRKLFTTAWKSYESGLSHCDAALAGSAGPSLACVRIQLGCCRLTNMSVATPKRVDQDSTGASKYATLLISKVE